MSDAVFHRTRRATARPAASESFPLPRGYGLLAGAAVSVALWCAILWLLGRVFG
jgi:hypothetical protein